MGSFLAMRIQVQMKIGKVLFYVHDIYNPRYPVQPLCCIWTLENYILCINNIVYLSKKNVHDIYKFEEIENDPDTTLVFFCHN